MLCIVRSEIILVEKQAEFSCRNSGIKDIEDEHEHKKILRKQVVCYFKVKRLQAKCAYSNA